MKILRLLAVSLLALSACNNNMVKEQKAIPSFKVTNTLDAPRKDAALKVSVQKLTSKFSDIDWEAVKFSNDGQAIPFQAIDSNADGITDEFILVMNFTASEEKTIQIQALAKGEEAPTFKKRTQAEISHKVKGEWKGRKYEGGEFKNVDYLHVPPEHTDHSWFIRYEGPGWESDLAGYRLYLDWRNATDIFGKTTPELVLQEVGQDGFDSYHEPADWGMDVLKVGSSLGVGSLGAWREGKALRVETTDSINCQIVENGALESKIQTKYYGWKAGEIATDVTSELSIQAGSRVTRHDVNLSAALPNLCTGIAKHENGNLLKHENGSWGYIATWGRQSLTDDHLGMAVLYNKNDLQEITEDEHSHVVVLSPTDNNLTYYFLAAWEQEPNGIQTEEAFKNYLKNLVLELGLPLVAKF